MSTIDERVRPDTGELLALVRAALATVLERDPDEIHPGTTLADLGADSLALVEVAEIVEEQLRARTGRAWHIPDTELESFRTVADAVDYAAASVA